MIKLYKLCRRQNNFSITLNYKGVKVRVSFTGGNTLKNIPAKSYVSDPFSQRAIEASQMFINHEIVIEKVIQEPGDNKQPVAVQTRKVVKKTAPLQTNKTPNAGTTAPKPAPKPEPKPDPAPEDEIPVEPGETDTDGNNTMEFASSGEAILYIAQQWQETAKTEKQAREILKAHGINPKIKKG